MSNIDFIEQYQKQEIFTMSSGELLVKLYDEFIKNIKYASVLFGQENVEAARKCTTKCKDIINYLIVILDGRYPISDNLRRIYSNWITQIIWANAKSDASYLDKIAPEIQDLREAWAQAEKTLRMQGGNGKGQSQ